MVAEMSGPPDVASVGGGIAGASMATRPGAEFGPEAAARRKRYGERAREGSHPELGLALAATSVGPDRAPAFVFEESVRRKLLEC